MNVLLKDRRVFHYLTELGEYDSIHGTNRAGHSCEVAALSMDIAISRGLPYNEVISLAVKDNRAIYEEEILPLAPLGFIDYPVPNKHNYITHRIETDKRNTIIRHYPSYNWRHSKYEAVELPPVIKK